MKPTHNVVYAESYKKDGEDKTRWHNIGVLMTGEKNGKKRTVLKLTTMPLNSDGFFNVFPIDKNRGKSAADEARGYEEGGDVDIDGSEPVYLSEIPF